MISLKAYLKINIEFERKIVMLIFVRLGLGSVNVVIDSINWRYWIKSDFVGSRDIDKVGEKLRNFLLGKTIIM